MDIVDYKTAFTEKASDAGFSYELINACLIYAEKLYNNNLPVIYDTSHFAGLVGYNKYYLERAIVFTNHFYRTFKIPKHNGFERKISEPLPSLKEIQSWILHNILYKIEPSRFAKAYVPGITLKQNILFHKDQKIVLTIDVKDFFLSIRRPKVEGLFKEIGYSTSISNLLSKLCTLNDRLPQGAPTSPYISNLVMIKFDEAVSNFALLNRIRYTRYADDITLSGDFDAEHALYIVKKELRKLSLEINQNKIRIMKPGTRQVVTGVVVNEKMQVSKFQRKEIRQQVYYLKRFGLTRHLEQINCKKKNYLLHLMGKVLFVLFIDPGNKEFIEYKEYLTELMKSS